MYMTKKNKDTSLTLITICFIAGFLMGGIIFSSQVFKNEKSEHQEVMIGHIHDDSHPHNESMMHDHTGLIEIQEGELVPTIKTTVTKDPMSGWNLYVETENFKFAPEFASTNHTLGEGHAHIYVNGEKLARLYSNWYHISTLNSGMNKITVSLNANDHTQYSYNDQLIEDSVTIMVE